MLRLSHCVGVEFRKGLHAIDQFDDPVSFVADQPGKGTVFVAGACFEQLRSTANAGERVLDFVCEHHAERRDRAGGAPMGQLSVHFFGNCTFLQHNRDNFTGLRQWRDENVDGSPVTGSGR